MICVYCHKAFQRNLSLAQIFTFRPLIPAGLCGSCEAKFTLNKTTANCRGCAKQVEATYCSDCQAWQRQYPELDFQHETFYHYNEALHDWFQQYKYKGDLNLGASFSQQLQAYFGTKKEWLVVPIPLGAKRLSSRGFNQVEVLLAKANVPYYHFLEKKEEQVAQTTKTKEERLASSQPFTLAKGAKGLIKGRQVLVVDDVYTTGRTLFHARDCLALGEPLKVATFSLAR